MGTDENLGDLTDLVGPELAGMVGNPAIAQPVKTSYSTSTGTNPGMPSDISDLRSVDLFNSSLSGVDIDRMFEDFQAEQEVRKLKMKYFESSKFHFSDFFRSRDKSLSRSTTTTSRAPRGRSSSHESQASVTRIPC